MQEHKKKEIKGKIIDWERKGNIVRFYLGKDKLERWWGDDWNDEPYEHNAGRVYEEFISGHKDIVIDFDDIVYEPSDFSMNSEYCKDDFRDRKVPFLIIIDNKNRDYFNNYTDAVIKAKKIYYLGDKLTY